MKVFFIFITILLSLLADMLAGNFGFSVSLTTGVMIYFAGILGSRAVYPLVIISGIFLDMCYARSAAFSPLILLCSVSAGLIMLPKPEHRFMLLRSLPAGAVSGGVFVLGNVISISCLYGKTGYPSGVAAHLITAMLFGLLSFPALILMLDMIAKQLSLPEYLTRLQVEIYPEMQQSLRLPIETASRRRRNK